MPKTYLTLAEKNEAAMVRQISAALNAAKREQAIGYKELYSITGMSPSTICEILKRPNKVSMVSVLRLCSALNVKLCVKE